MIRALQRNGRPTVLGRAIGELGRIYKTLSPGVSGMMKAIADAFLPSEIAAKHVIVEPSPSSMGIGGPGAFSVRFNYTAHG